MTDKENNVYLVVKDYSVSNETFNLVYDENLDMLITSPQPTATDLPKYYESKDYISHSDKKSGLLNLLYQFVRNFTLKSKIQIIERYQPLKGNLLDIGAGTGHFGALARNKSWNVTGIEPNDGARNIAEKKGINFADNISDLQDHYFDVITLWHVLEHVPDVTEQIKQLNRILKPEGTLIIAVPNFKSFDAQYYQQFWAGYDVPRHLWHFSKNSIAKLFDAEAIKIADIIPMKFDAYYVSLLSEKYKLGKMNYFKAFSIALKSNQKARRNLEYSSLIYVLKKTT